VSLNERRSKNLTLYIEEPVEGMHILRDHVMLCIVISYFG
jgi:hypothetical protein